MFVYLPVSCAGFFVYGNYQDGQANIALMISDGPLRITAQVLLIAHLFCAFLVVINPCFQDLESYLHIKSGRKFSRILQGKFRGLFGNPFYGDSQESRKRKFWGV